MQKPTSLLLYRSDGAALPSASEHGCACVPPPLPSNLLQPNTSLQVRRTNLSALAQP